MTDADTPMRLAVVDDDQFSRRILERVIRREGHHVELFTSPDEILAVEGPPWDGLITDFHMPGTNGLRLATELRARGMVSRVVVLTGVEERTLGGALEGAVYMEKPIPFARLRQLLADWHAETLGAA